ncbi:MAG: glutathione S-transferase family protein, partial [Marinobacter sp.]
CNRQRISDFPALSGYLRELYQVPGVASTVNVDQIKRHYFVSQRTVNPTQIVPVGPSLDFTAPHGREGLS